MRIQANENFPGDAVAILRQHGHDVFWARTDSPGASDKWLLEQAQLQERLVVTFDKDFGELAFRCHLPSSCGVLLFRLSLRSPHQDVQYLVDILESREDWAGHFSVVEKDRLRMRPMD